MAQHNEFDQSSHTGEQQTDCGPSNPRAVFAIDSLDSLLGPDGAYLKIRRDRRFGSALEDRAPVAQSYLTDALELLFQNAGDDQSVELPPIPMPASPDGVVNEFSFRSPETDLVLPQQRGAEFFQPEPAFDEAEHSSTESNGPIQDNNSNGARFFVLEDPSDNEAAGPSLFDRSRTSLRGFISRQKSTLNKLSGRALSRWDVAADLVYEKLFANLHKAKRHTRRNVKTGWDMAADYVDIKVGSAKMQARKVTHSAANFIKGEKPETRRRIAVGAVAALGGTAIAATILYLDSTKNNGALAAHISHLPGRGSFKPMASANEVEKSYDLASKLHAAKHVAHVLNAGHLLSLHTNGDSIEGEETSYLRQIGLKATNAGLGNLTEKVLHNLHKSWPGARHLAKGFSFHLPDISEIRTLIKK